MDLLDLSKVFFGSWMVESFVFYERELVVIGVCNVRGEMEIYLVVEIK